MRVVVHQRQRLFRDGLTSLLGRAGDVVVVGAVEDGKELLEACERSRPDVAVVDVDRGDPDPWPALVALRRLLPQVAVVAVHGPHAGVDLERMRRTGVATVVPRSEGIDAVLRAVRGGRVAASAGRLAPLRGGPCLTTRETTVLKLVAGGRTSREISRELRVSHKTVENHKQRMFAKLGVQNQAHAVAVAIRYGMIAPDPRASVAAGG